MRTLAVVFIAVVAMVIPVAASAAPRTMSIVHLSAPVSGLRYDQKVVHAHAGRIEIIFLNRSKLKHNVNVESGEHELGHTTTISHATTRMFVRLKVGRYNFYCSVPGHEDAGMHGTLVVS